MVYGPYRSENLDGDDAYDDNENPVLTMHYILEKTSFIVCFNKIGEKTWQVYESATI